MVDHASNGHGDPPAANGPGEPPNDDDLVVTFTGVSAKPNDDGTIDLIIGTNRGDIRGILHPREGQDGAVIFVGGGRDLTGPADGIYKDLAAKLTEHGVTSLRLGQRRSEVFIEAVADVLAGISFMRGIGAGRLALVGHSSNGAVAIKSAAFSPLVVAVASLSGQTFGAQDVAEIAPRRLLVVHGREDDVLPYTDAERIYEWAGEPKELILYDGANHGLREAGAELRDTLERWLVEVVGPAQEGYGSDSSSPNT